MAQAWEVFSKIFTQMGWDHGLFVILLLVLMGAGCYIHRLYKQNIQDKQDQIDALAAENREYRERFLAFSDRAMDYKPTRKKPLENGQNKEQLPVRQKKNAPK